MPALVTADRIAVGIYEYHRKYKKSIPSPIVKSDFYNVMRAMSLGSQSSTLRSEWVRFRSSKYIEEIVDDDTIVPNIYLITKEAQIHAIEAARTPLEARE